MKGLIRWSVFMALMGWLCIVVVRAEVIENGFISLSIRTPNQLDIEEYDYEVKGGIVTTYGKINLFTERENAEYYKGLYLLTVESKKLMDLIFDGWQGEINIREAQEISQQNIYKRVLGVKYFRMQAVANFTHWADVRLMGSVEYDRKWIKVKIKTDLQEILAEAYLGKKLKVIFPSKSHRLLRKLFDDRLYFHPFILWNNYGVRDFVQLKVELGISL